jgi:beta-glucosidase
MTKISKHVRMLGVYFILICAANSSCAQKLAYQNSKLPVKQRVADLLKRMTLEEKVAQMCQFVGPEHIQKAEKTMTLKQMKKSDAFGFYPGLKSSDIERMVEQGKIGSFLHVVTAAEANHLQQLAQKSRLKIPLLIGIDAIHGNGMVKGCTIYPSPIGISCTWDTSLVHQTGKYTAMEMRATGSQWAFSPNLDITRDPRWGRTGETYGEDPFLVSSLGVAMINGLQQNGAIACAKHLIAGSESVNGLNKAPTDVSERTLKEIFLPPYQAAVKAGVFSVMPAHNEINGVPGHANKFLMTDVLRRQWNFKGFYVSDWMDIEQLIEMHRIAKTQKEAVRATVNAGMDMHMHGPNFMEPLIQLVKEGKVPLQRVNEAASLILEAKFKAGLFEQQQVSEAKSSVIDPAHKALSLQAAQRSIVLLKNDGLLPLTGSKYKKIMVTGPNANNQSILGDWSLKQPDENVITVYEGIKQAASKDCEVSFEDVGRFIPDMQANTVKEVANKAKEADLVIVVVGDNALRFEGNKRTSGENTDRDDLMLPGLQQQLVEELYKAGKPVIVVLVNGRPLALPWIDEHIPAIVEAWEPGSFGGQAIADVLFGKVNPSGKLTVSFPRNVGQIGNYYNHKPSQYMLNYIGSKTGPLYPFGYGLSYTSFSMSDITLSSTNIKAGQSIKATVKLINTGKIAGQETVQLYINGSISEVTKPVKELKAFKLVNLQPGEVTQVQFTVAAESFKSYDINLNHVIEPGEFCIMIGNSSNDDALKKHKVTISR